MLTVVGFVDLEREAVYEKSDVSDCSQRTDIVPASLAEVQVDDLRSSLSNSFHKPIESKNQRANSARDILIAMIKRVERTIWYREAALSKLSSVGVLQCSVQVQDPDIFVDAKT